MGLTIRHSAPLGQRENREWQKTSLGPSESILVPRFADCRIIRDPQQSRSVRVPDRTWQHRYIIIFSIYWDLLSYLQYGVCTSNTQCTRTTYANFQVDKRPKSRERVAKLSLSLHVCRM